MSKVLVIRMHTDFEDENVVRDVICNKDAHEISLENPNDLIEITNLTNGVRDGGWSEIVIATKGNPDVDIAEVSGIIRHNAECTVSTLILK